MHLISQVEVKKKGIFLQPAFFWGNLSAVVK